MPGIHGQSWEPPKLRASNELVVTKEADLAYRRTVRDHLHLGCSVLVHPFIPFLPQVDPKGHAFEAPCLKYRKLNNAYSSALPRKASTTSSFPCHKKRTTSHPHQLCDSLSSNLYKNQCVQIKMPLDPNNPGSISSFQHQRSKS